MRRERALLEKSPDADLLRQVIGFASQRQMELEVGALTGAAYGEKSSGRLAQRNGYRERDRQTWAGTVSCAFASYSAATTFLAFWSHAGWPETALAAMIQEAYVQGVSARSVNELVQTTGGSGISKSRVSRLREEIDERVHAFLGRPIEGDWPYLWLDATYVKTRQAGRIVSVAVGVNADDRREVLSMDVGPSQAQTFLEGLSASAPASLPAGRETGDLRRPREDKAAVSKVLAATWQHCRVHFMRNVLVHTGKRGRRVCSAFIATAFAQNHAKVAGRQWRYMPTRSATNCPNSQRSWIRPSRIVRAYTNLPAARRVKLHRTNPLERLIR